MDKDKVQAFLHKIQHQINNINSKCNTLLRSNKLIRHRTAGEVLPNSRQAQTPLKIPNKKTMVLMIIAFLFFLYIDNSIHWLGILLKSESQKSAFHSIPLAQALILALNPFHSKIGFNEVFILLIISPIITVLALQKIGIAVNGETDSTIAYGQKGDSRFTTRKEIQEQYKCIPEKDKTFSGYGGFPISHYQHDYYIDDEPVHNLIFGTSRIGKSDGVIVPMLDNLSRAEKQSSLVVNDPKKELYTAFADVLRERGYDVYLFNLADPMNSMSYNPLSLVTEKFQEGKEDEADQLLNSVTYTLFRKKKEGENAWVYQGAQSGANAFSAEIIRMCLNPTKFADGKAHPEKVTLHNLDELVTQLNSQYYLKLVNNKVEQVSVLDDYFDHLPQDSYAKQEYAILKTQPGKTRGNIVGNLLQDLKIFQLPQNAAMTSMNSIDLRSIGFPKYVKFKLPVEMEDQKIILRFRKPQKNGSKHSKIIKEFPIIVGIKGYVDYNFDVQLQDGDWMEICYQENATKVKHSLVELSFSKKTTTQNNHQLATKVLFDELEISKIKFHYSDKPTAIFLSIPDYDRSNNAIAAIFIQQMYSELARQCANVAGNKTVRRVNCIFDEFGNMPTISNMDNLMTVSAGRNILFTLALQSDKQLYDSYGREVGSTIKENGQNQKLIKCIDNQTNEDFSKSAGQQTIEASSVGNSANNHGKSTSTSIHAEAVPIITASRLSQMLAGEDFNIRAVHRFDKWGKRVRPYPIFNTGETIMPGAHTFMKNLNMRANPNLVRVESLHKDLNLKELEIDFVDFLRGTASEAAVKAYESNVNESKVSAQQPEISSNGDKQKMDNLEQIEEKIVDEDTTDEQEEKRSKSDFARLVVDYKSHGLEVDLAEKILSAFDEDDSARVRTCINSIEDDEIRTELESEFNKESRE